jgi:RNA polymerase sigma-B factor
VRFTISAIAASKRTYTRSVDSPVSAGSHSGRTGLRAVGAQLTYERLVERFLPLARKLARRYERGREPLEDLVQVASLGLVKAAQRYDESRGVPFGTYAAYSIDGELKRHLRDHTWALHVPRGAKDRALQVNRAFSAAEQSGHTLNARELADRLGLSEQEVLDANEAWLALEAQSLDAPATSQDEQEPQSLLETIGSVDGGYELADQRFTLEAAWRELPLRERRVLHMRFVEDQRQRDIATQIGVSQVQVSRMVSRGIKRLQLVVDGGQDGECPGCQRALGAR